LEIGFIDHVNLQFVTTLNYSAIANFHNLVITTAYAKSFQSSVISTSLSLVTASNIGDSSTEPTKHSLHRFPYNSLLAHSVATPTNFQTVSVLKSRHGQRRKHAHFCAPIISMGVRLFAKALPSNGCV
jgi:hypothetical protein